MRHPRNEDVAADSHGNACSMSPILKEARRVAIEKLPLMSIAAHHLIHECVEDVFYTKCVFFART